MQRRWILPPAQDDILVRRLEVELGISPVVAGASEETGGVMRSADARRVAARNSAAPPSNSQPPVRSSAMRRK